MQYIQYFEYLNHLEEKYGKPAVTKMVEQMEEDKGPNAWDLFTDGQLELLNDYLPEGEPKM